MQVRRRDFVDTLSRQGGQIDIRRMSPNLRSALRERGVSGAELRSIAGRDHVIRGQEFSQLYDRVFGGRAAQPAATGRGDLQRSLDLYGLLRSESARGASASEQPAIGIGATRSARPGGESHAHTHPSGSSGSDLGVDYTAPTTPGVDPDVAAPEKPNWFMAMLEFLFGWLGMETDTDRLTKHGQHLANEYGAEIDAFRTAYANEHGASRSSNGMPVRGDVLAREMRSELIDRVAARMETQGVSSSDARERAGIVVDAMLERVDTNAERDASTGAAQGLVAPDSAAGRRLASVAASTRRSAQRLDAAGDANWSRRVDTALTPLANDHPWVAANPPERQDQARAAATEDRLRAVQYLMALDQSGGLAALGNDKNEIVDGLLSSQLHYDAGSGSVGAAASALAHLTPTQQTEVLTATRAVPENQRAIIFGVVAREHGSLASSDPAERAGAIARVRSAAAQMSATTPEESRAALNRGTLGLDESTLTLNYGHGRTIDVPMYFHPGVSAEDRTIATDLVREAYGHLPYAAMQHVVAGEGDQGFNVQILPNGSFNAGGSADPARPSTGDGAHAFYQTDDNQIRINMSMFAHDLDTNPAARDRLVTMVLHETVHELDDLGNADQNLGFFVHHNHDRARDRARTTGDGDLAPTWQHVRRARARFDDQSTAVGDSRRARRYFTLSRQSSRSPDEERELLRLGDEIARRSGTTTPYSATGGNGQQSLQMAEWWAETYSRYANPSTRGLLRSVDPVGHRAAARYHELLSNGTSPPEAIRDALRFSLATDVAAAQGTAILSDGESLGATELNDLDAIGRAYDDHAAALDGWTPYRNDASLRAARRDEAQASVDAGRTFLAAIAERKAAVEASGGRDSESYRRLSALETRVQSAVTALEAHIDTPDS